jgi:ubiquinone/menaquinone biosynthesis C-methylase UbiE
VGSEGEGSRGHRWFAAYQARAAEEAERKGGAEHRRRLLEGLGGDVLEVGVGSGINFRHYPATVQRVLAVEPDPSFRERAAREAEVAPVPVDVVEGEAEHLPAPDASMDAVVVAGVLCSVPDQRRALAEFARVLRPEGELRFYEHVAADGGFLRALQRALDGTVWPRLFAGCHPARSTESAIRDAGFEPRRVERFAFHPTLLSFPVTPRILGSAVKPGERPTSAV